jgi:hypothetical protein
MFSIFYLDSYYSKSFSFKYYILVIPITSIKMYGRSKKFLRVILIRE